MFWDRLHQQVGKKTYWEDVDIKTRWKHCDKMSSGQTPVDSHGRNKSVGPRDSCGKTRILPANQGEIFPSFTFDYIWCSIPWDFDKRWDFWFTKVSEYQNAWIFSIKSQDVTTCTAMPAIPFTCIRRPLQAGVEECRRAAGRGCGTCPLKKWIEMGSLSFFFGETVPDFGLNFWNTLRWDKLQSFAPSLAGPTSEWHKINDMRHGIPNYVPWSGVRWSGWACFKRNETWRITPSNLLLHRFPSFAGIAVQLYQVYTGTESQKYLKYGLSKEWHIPLKTIPGYQLGYGIFFFWNNFPGIISSRGRYTIMHVGTLKIMIPPLNTPWNN